MSINLLKFAEGFPGSSFGSDFMCQARQCVRQVGGDISLGIYLEFRVRLDMMPVLRRMADWVSDRPAGKGPFFIFLNNNCKG